MRNSQYTPPAIETLQGREILERFGPVAGGSFAAVEPPIKPGFQTKR